MNNSRNHLVHCERPLHDKELSERGLANARADVAERALDDVMNDIQGSDANDFYAYLCENLATTLIAAAQQLHRRSSSDYDQCVGPMRILERAAREWAEAKSAEDFPLGGE